MKTFSELKKNLKKDFSGLKSVRVGVLGDTATQFLVQVLRGAGFDYGLDLHIWEADFNQIERQVFDPASEVYAFKPEVVIVFQSTHKLLGKYNKLEADKRAQLAAGQATLVKDISATLHSRLNAKVIYYNFPEIDDSVFGSYASKVESSFLFQLRKLNYDLMLLAGRHANLYLCDLSSLQNRMGRETVFQSSIYINTDMVLSMDVLPEMARRTLDILSALQGKFKKCLILDLDNTLWGGIIGDDGLENIQLGALGIGKAFTEFQHWVKKLKERGILICLCSKNTESVAREPFEKHPDMVLGLKDISVFVANWENKVDNIRYIQSVLNIGFDSMVFLDDNPFERSMVRENIPDITVPELPEDPADYLGFLYAQNLFETVSFSNEDLERTKLYQVEAERKELQSKFTHEEEFLESLGMVSLVEPFTKFNTPRVAQLSQRSNQFNLRTVRYTEPDIETLASSENTFPFAFGLKDKFGDHGMICVVILKRESTDSLFIDTWLMSCRVLKRGMENFVLNTVASLAKEKGYTFLKGEYLPTAKNEMVKDHYAGLGFENAAGRWILNVSAYQNRQTTILSMPKK